MDQYLAKVGVEGSNPFARSNFLPQASWQTAILIPRGRVGAFQGEGYFARCA